MEGVPQIFFIKFNMLCFNSVSSFLILSGWNLGNKWNKKKVDV